MPKFPPLFHVAACVCFVFFNASWKGRGRYRQTVQENTRPAVSHLGKRQQTFIAHNKSNQKGGEKNTFASCTLFFRNLGTAVRCRTTPKVRCVFFLPAILQAVSRNKQKKGGGTQLIDVANQGFFDGYDIFAFGYIRVNQVGMQLKPLFNGGRTSPTRLPQFLLKKPHFTFLIRIPSITEKHTFFNL